MAPNPNPAILAATLTGWLFCPPATAEPEPGLATRTMHFEKNVGQVDAAVSFLARGAGYTLFLTPEAAVFALPDAPPVRMELLGASPFAPQVGTDERQGRVNWFKGRDPSAWRTDIPTFGAVTCEDVYPGVDMVYFARGGRLEYDFVLEPYADPGAIVLRFDGAERVRVDDAGDLVIETQSGELRHGRPWVCQEVGGERRPVAGAFEVAGETHVRFVVHGHDHAIPLVIDPWVSFSTFVGGSGSDVANGVAADAAGNTYVVGQTFSADFPTQGASQGALNGSSDMFVVKFDETGQLVFATYLGGEGSDAGNDIALAPNGSMWITGQTTSAAFPVTTNAAQTSHGGQLDGVYVLLGSGGNQLLLSSYIGGAGQDIATAVAADPDGGACAAGITDDAASFPHDFTYVNTADPLSTWASDVNTAKTTSFVFGGNGDDVALDTACHKDPVTGAKQVAVLMQTGSSDLPVTANAYQPSPGGSSDAAIAVFDSAGTLAYTTYVGGSGDEAATQEGGLAFDENGWLVATFPTGSTDLATTPGAPQTSYGGGLSDAYALTLDTFTGGANALKFGTYLGGSDADFSTDLWVGPDTIVLAGGTRSADFVQVGSPQAHSGAGQIDMFLSRLRDTDTIDFSMLWGGNFGHDYPKGIDVRDGRYIHAAGVAESFQFPTTPGAFDDTIGGFVDGFAFVVDADAQLPSIYGTGTANPATGLIPAFTPETTSKPAYMGETFTLGMTDLAPSSAGFLVIGVSDANFQVNGFQLLVDVTQPNVIVPFSVPGTEFSFSGTSPVIPSSTDIRVFLQSVFAKGSAYSATPGLDLPLVSK